MSLQPATLNEGGEGLEVGWGVMEGFGYDGSGGVAGGPGFTVFKTYPDRGDDFPERAGPAFLFNPVYPADVVLLYVI